MVSFILIKNNYAKNAKKCPKIAIIGLFWLIDSTKLSIIGSFDKPEFTGWSAWGHWYDKSIFRG